MTGDHFTVRFVDAAGLVRVALPDAVCHVPLEDGSPVRQFPAYHGQRHYPGLWWLATTGRHIGYESWLERVHVMLLDFDADVIGIASQPCWFCWRDDGRQRKHAPDYFARLADGTGVMIDCRPAERIDARAAAVFEQTRHMCAQVGWRYRLVGTPDPQLAVNVCWLAGYRHPRNFDAALALSLLDVFARPCPLFAGAAAVGEPLAVLPVLYHLLWRGTLRIDLATAWRRDAAVWATRDL